MEFKDYYEILGVKPEADTKEIKNAYRHLARKYHPDMNPDAGAEAKFKDVAEAYKVLKDEGTRAEYDELRKYGGNKQNFTPPPGWQSSGGFSGGEQHFEGGDFSDFFNSIFSGGASGFRQGGAGADRGFKGRDIDVEMPIFLEETVSELSKNIEFILPVFENGQMKEVKKSLKVKIPQGVADGERIRLKGQGGPGQGKGTNGDLYLHVRLVPHPLYDVQGHNLVITVPLAPWEAALGAKITIPTLTGKISLTISPNSQSGQKLRMKGKGLTGKTGSGDLIAVLNVVMPKEASEESKKLWANLAEKSAFNPRAEWEQ